MAQESGNSNQNLERIGKLSIDKSLSCPYKIGDNFATFKTQVFRGIFEKKTMVCVRRYETASSKYSCTNKTSKEDHSIVNPIERDINVLQEPKHLHENFIRYFCSEDDNDTYTYVATEWCICSVEDLYEGNIKEGLNWTKEKIYTELIKESLGEKEILRQATEGVAFLHALGFVHRNLKPSNFMIAQLQQFRCDRFRYLVKLSDFRLSKNPVDCPNVSGNTGSKGWTYPKMATMSPSTYQRGDVFILGCFFHYVLTNGKHPFGDNKADRENNINASNHFVYNSKDWKPENIKDQQAIDLLKKMIKFELNDICKLDEVFASHYFLPNNFYQLYDLPDVKPGLCVIINQEIFETEDNRVGSNLDEESLRDVFQQLGFDVRIFKDLKAKNLRNCIEDLAKQDFSSYASLVVCILSHGNEGVVVGVDGENVKINELKYKFNSNHCPTLNGKPKIWIIQACQGTGIQFPIKQTKCSQGPTSSESDSGDIVPQQNVFEVPAVPIKKPKEIPEEKMPYLKENKSQPTTSEGNKDIRPPLMDFLDIRASISGFQAFRGKGFGSYLIQYLCEELENEYLSNNSKSNQEQKSLGDILESVQNHITTGKIFATLLEPNTGEEVTVEVKQTIEWRSSLSDKIIFKKAGTQGTVTNISTPEPPQLADDLSASLIASFLNFFFK